MPIKYLVLSLILFLIYSCASDDTSGPSPATIVGTWSSGELSYHSTDDCLNEGQSLEDFVNTSISNNIEIEAQNTAALVCVDESEYEDCLAGFIELYTNNFEADGDSLLFDVLISNTFSYNNMTLIINSGSSYETQYDGSCIGANSLSSEFCEIIEGAEWNMDLDTCELLTEAACEGGEGYWNDGWVGDWEESGDNYTLFNFNDDEAATKTLVFDGNDLFIVLSTTDDQCLCSTSTPSETSADCVDVDDCIWLEGHCISLNFSK